jgi:antitoxin component HigA of HigAB toxin-antitoxin module
MRSNRILSSRLTAIQQLGNGKMGLIDYARLMIPHKLKGGMLYTIEGKEMKDLAGYEDVADQEITPAKLFEQKQVTQAWRNNVVHAVNQFINSPAEEPVEEAEVEEVEEVEEKAVEEKAVEEKAVDTSAIEKAIAKGKMKKAKKLLKELKSELSKEKYNELKEEIK